MMPKSLTHLTRLCAALLVALSFCGTAPASAQEAYFETDTLNPGLDARPDSMDLATPMAAMETFMYLTDRGQFDEAAHVLDLSDVPEEDQQSVGRERARELSVIFERKVMIPWSDLADRPDGWITGSSDDDSTGRVRRSILIERMDREDHTVPLRLNRIKAGEDASPVWVMSRQSVENIPALFELYGPTEVEKALPDWLRIKALWGMYLWEVLFLPLILIVALLVAFIAYRLLKRIGSEAPNQWLRTIARSLKWPVAMMLTAAIVGTATSRVLVVTGIIDAVISPFVIITYVFSITLAIVLIIDEIFDRVSQSSPDELADPENAHLRAVATTVSAARKFVIVIAALTGTGVVLSSISSFGTLGLSLLASAGAVTVILGFAAREVLGNILASVQIALNRSARIGDQIMFEGHFCTVERIHFTYVQLMVWDGRRLIVPVSTFVEDPFENWSLEENEMVRAITLTLMHGADIERLRQVFFDLVGQEDDEDISPRESTKVHVMGQDSLGVTVRFEVPTANPATAWEVECRVRERLLAAASRIESEDDVQIFPKIAAESTIA